MRNERYYKSKDGWKQTLSFNVFNEHDEIIAKMSIDCDSTDDPQNIMREKAIDIYGPYIHI